MAISRTMVSSSQKILSDLKAPGLFDQVVELDKKALTTIGRYRAICEGKWQGEVKEGEIIPYKQESYSRISLALSILLAIPLFLLRADVLPCNDETKLFTFISTMIACHLPLSELFRIISTQVKNNKFHKRLPPETQVKFKSEFKEYFHKRISLFAQHPEESINDTRSLISQELNYDMLRLLVDCYRFLDDKDPDFLAKVTHMIDTDFIHYHRFASDELEKLKKEYDGLRIEKQQHIR
ncbi:MAG: hypothetical protein ACYCQI_13690 [Gammaproteobacteria bacterium]